MEPEFPVEQFNMMFNFGAESLKFAYTMVYMYTAQVECKCWRQSQRLLVRWVSGGSCVISSKFCFLSFHHHHLVLCLLSYQWFLERRSILLFDGYRREINRR